MSSSGGVLEGAFAGHPGQGLGDLVGSDRAVPAGPGLATARRPRWPASHGLIFPLDVDPIVAVGNGYAQRLPDAAQMLIPRSEQSQQRLGVGNR